MLPKYHILLGAIFSFTLYLIGISLFYSVIIFLASVFIDIDHYIWYVQRKKDWGLRKAYIWHKEQPQIHKPVMHIFHTIEFIFIIIVLSFYSKLLLFISVGLLFHSFLDIIDMIPNKRYLCREFSFIKYIINRDKKASYL